MEHHANYPDEILAIVAHELGHWHHDHTLWMAVFNLGYMFIFACVMTPLIGNEQFLLAFGIKMQSYFMTFFLYALLYYFTLDVIIRLFIKWKERRNEYQADAYSVELGYGDALYTSLIRHQAHNKGIVFRSTI